jgi:hypothetical protein
MTLKTVKAAKATLRKSAACGSERNLYKIFTRNKKLLYRFDLLTW